MARSRVMRTACTPGQAAPEHTTWFSKRARRNATRNMPGLSGERSSTMRTGQGCMYWCVPASHQPVPCTVHTDGGATCRASAIAHHMWTATHRAAAPWQLVPCCASAQASLPHAGDVPVAFWNSIQDLCNRACPYAQGGCRSPPRQRRPPRPARPLPSINQGMEPQRCSRPSLHLARSGGHWTPRWGLVALHLLA